MASYAPRVRETTTSTGSGNLTTSGNVIGFQGFATVFGTGTPNYFYYVIEAVDGSGVPTGDWEYGIGHMSASNTLVRDLILKSSNSNAAVTLAAGTKNIFCPAPGRPFRTQLQVSTDTAIGASTWTPVAWGAAAALDDGLAGGWVVSPNPSRIIVPTGFTECRLRGQIIWQPNSSNGQRLAGIGKNQAGSSSYSALQQIKQDPSPLNEAPALFSTQWLSVAAADYFEIFVLSSGSTTSSRTYAGASGSVFGKPTYVEAEWR